MRMGIGFDMLLLMALSCVAIDCSYGDIAKKDSVSEVDRPCLGKQLSDLQISYGMDNVVAPASSGRDGPACTM